MKFLAVILSLYILGLNGVPCDDFVIDDIQRNFTMVWDADQDHQGNHAADDCSPFCECHCCHIHALNFTPNIPPIIEPAISTLIIQRGEGLGEEMPRSHFQPPRV